MLSAKYEILKWALRDTLVMAFSIIENKCVAGGDALCHLKSIDKAYTSSLNEANGDSSEAMHALLLLALLVSKDIVA